ncbi:MAG: crotonase, partial [Mesorhizobium sp.]
ILFHCDMVIASDESTFRVPFVDFGLVPDAATSILAPQKLGYAGAFRFFCLGDTLSAADARMLGLVTEIVVGDVEEAALGRARQLAKKPVAALLQTRDLLKGDTGA